MAMDPWPAFTVISSLAIRGSAYAFLRWIPGHHFPPIVLYSLIIFLVSFALTSRETSPYEVVADEVDIVLAETKEKENFETEDQKNTAISDDDSDEDEEVELDIRETIVLAEKDPQIFKTLVFGLPSPTSPLWSLFTLAINIALALCVADMIFRGPLLYQSHDLSFIRVGHVSDSAANLLIREPDLSKLPIYVSYRNAENAEHESKKSVQSEQPWKTAGQIYWLSNETDFTYPLSINRLQPATRYEYATSNNQSGYFSTAPLIGETSPHDIKFTFLTSSCIKPRFPYNPLGHPLEIPGFRYLAQWIPKLQASFMLFLGDFIYVDVPRRFGTDRETYRREYRQVYVSPSWPAVSSLPWIHVLDDHEIANDWDGNTTSPYPPAIDPFTHYQASINPPPVHDGATYFSFTQSLASFFLLDTRSYRTPEFAPADPSSPSKSMLGKTQLQHLLAFLRKPSPPGVHWKFVVSSIPFTRNWRFNNADTWAGYLHERQAILEAMWDVGATSSTGVIVLSGDRHEFAATSFPPPAGGKWPLAATVHEFSTSPLSMFYLPVRTYAEDEADEPREVCIKYLPDGNSKFGIVEIEKVSGDEQSLVRFRLVVDGEEVWAYVVSSPPGGKGRGKDAVWG